MKFYISDSMSSVYPDITVICGPPEFEWPRKDIVRNPTLVVEVLSPETAAYDRGGKFHKYWSLPSLREYVLVEQSEPSVDVFFLDAFGKWQIDSDLGLDQTFELRSLGLQVTMAGLSRGVEV